MHYKRKGDRVDEVLHDVVLDHVNRLEHENKHLRAALEEIETSSAGDFDGIRQIARQALQGDTNA